MIRHQLKKWLHAIMALVFLLQQVVPYSPAFAMKKHSYMSHDDEDDNRNSNHKKSPPGISYSKNLDDDYPDDFPENDDDDDQTESEEARSLSLKLDASSSPSTREERAVLPLL